MIPAVVGPPRSGMSERQAGWVQGSGACKRSLDGKTNSPHYGGYTTHAVESGDPPHGVIVVVVVVEYYCFLINIIVDAPQPRPPHFYLTKLMILTKVPILSLRNDETASVLLCCCDPAVAGGPA